MSTLRTMTFEQFFSFIHHSILLSVYYYNYYRLCRGLVSRYTGAVVLLLMVVLVLPLTWYSTLYMQVMDPRNERYLSDEDSNWFLKLSLRTSKLVATSLGLRVTLFLGLSLGLFVVAISNMVGLGRACTAKPCTAAQQDQGRAEQSRIVRLRHKRQIKQSRTVPISIKIVQIFHNNIKLIVNI